MAWNEPNNGKKKDPWGGGQQPPDLDQIIRSLKRKVGGFFGDKKGGLGKKGSGGASISAGVVGVIALLLWGLSGIFIVDPAEQAVILRLGKYARTVGPGPHWIPRFIERRYIVNVRKVENFSYTAQMLNKDENIVSVSVAVQYRVGDLKNYLFNVVNPHLSLHQATASALRQVVGHTTLDEVLTTGREKVRQQVTEQLEKILALYKTGLIIEAVAMQPAKAPEEVKGAFDDAIKAQEDEQRFVNQAVAYARRVEPIAEGQAKRILQEAGAYKQQVILRAEGDVARFLALLPEYKRAPKVTKQRLYIETLESVLGNVRKVLVDVEGGSNMLYLPLDKIMGDRVPKLNQQVAGIDEPSDIGKLAQPTSRTTTGIRAGRESYRGRGAY